MSKLNQLENIIKLADHLDRIGLIKEADYLDDIIKTAFPVFFLGVVIWLLFNSFALVREATRNICASDDRSKNIFSYLTEQGLLPDNNIIKLQPHLLGALVSLLCKYKDDPKLGGFVSAIAKDRPMIYDDVAWVQEHIIKPVFGDILGEPITWEYKLEKEGFKVDRANFKTELEYLLENLENPRQDEFRMPEERYDERSYSSKK